MKTIVLTAALVLACVGCTAPTVMITGKTYAPTDPAAVKIYQTGKPAMPYEEIGRISITKWNSSAYIPYVGLATGDRSGDEVTRLFREKAASLGGDAVINITEDIGGFSGVVIKLKSQ